jgi:hypothetical protein
LFVKKIFVAELSSKIICSIYNQRQCFGSRSALDPHLIDFLDPDLGGVKSSKTEEKTVTKDGKSTIKSYPSV